MPLISEPEIRDALTRLGARAHAAGETIELIAVGGAVMVLAFRARVSTQDVDAVVKAPRPVRDAQDRSDALRLLQELGTDKASVWRSVEPFVTKGNELKACYAFDEIWSEIHGDD